MTSLEVYEAKQTIKNFVNGLEIPTECKRMMMAEITQEISQQSQTEAIAELTERKKKEEDN